MYLNEIPPRITLQTPDGKQGIATTLKIMRGLVNGEKGKKSGAVRSKALELVKYIPQQNFAGRVSAVWRFVKDRISYVRDTNGVEVVHWPEQVLAQRAGDCDDHAVLLASLLESVGVPTLFKAVGVRGGEICHVYTQAKIGNKWVSLETTVPGAPMGWEPPNITDKILIHNKR